MWLRGRYVLKREKLYWSSQCICVFVCPSSKGKTGIDSLWLAKLKCNRFSFLMKCFGVFLHLFHWVCKISQSKWNSFRSAVTIFFETQSVLLNFFISFFISVILCFSLALYAIASVLSTSKDLLEWIQSVLRFFHCVLEIPHFCNKMCKFISSECGANFLYIWQTDFHFIRIWKGYRMSIANEMENKLGSIVELEAGVGGVQKNCSVIVFDESCSAIGQS